MHPLFLTITKSTAEGFTGTLFFSVRSSIMNLYVHTFGFSNYKTSLQNPSFLKIIKPNLCVPVCCRLLSWWVHHRPAQRVRTHRRMGFFFSFYEKGILVVLNRQDYSFERIPASTQTFQVKLRVKVKEKTLKRKPCLKPTCHHSYEFSPTNRKNRTL